MIDKRIGNLRLKLYSGIDELTAERFHKFNLYTLIATGIGSDVTSLQNHITLIYQALNKKDYDRLKTLFENYHHSIHLITEQIDTQCVAFACLVHSINGDEITDISDENLIKISKRITKNVRRVEALQVLEEIKKKLKMKPRSISRIELARYKQESIINSLNDLLNQS